MTSIIHRNPNHQMSTAVGGKGIYLFDSDGRKYIDASGGAAVSCLGHGDPDVSRAIKDQLDRLAYAHTSFFTTEPAEELAAWLCRHSPERLNHVCFASGGSEAVEAAVKLARQYFVERGQPARSRIIARRQSYHGYTIATLAIGENADRKAIYRPWLMDVEHIAPCYAYRDMAPGETLEEYGARVAAELDEAASRLGPETVAAFVAETVVGATAGAVPAVSGYFKRIREICDRHGILLILDEVMCGMGRTGTLHACEQDDVVPDILVVAKGLAAGYMPLGAAIISDEIFSAIADGTGAFRHAHTFMGHPLACAAGLAAVNAIEGRGLLDAVRCQGTLLFEKLRARFAEHPFVGDIRGRGLFVGVEIVQDRTSKETFDPEFQAHARIKREAMDRGLLCYPGGGTADGTRGDHVLIAPPYIVSDDEIAEIVDRLSSAINAALELDL